MEVEDVPQVGIQLTVVEGESIALHLSCLIKKKFVTTQSQKININFLRSTFQKQK
jgi:hypothetical protein